MIIGFENGTFVIWQSALINMRTLGAVVDSYGIDERGSYLEIEQRKLRGGEIVRIGESEIIGKKFKAWDGHVYVCDRYEPRAGFWMTCKDREWQGIVSERAIGHMFERIYAAPQGDIF